MSSTSYFATLPYYSHEYGRAVEQHITDYYKHLQTTYRMSMMRQAFRYNHSGYSVAGTLWSEGSQGVYKRSRYGQFRNLLQHVKALTTSDRPAFDPMARNSDMQSLVQTKLGAQILDYYMRAKGMEGLGADSVEDAVVYGEAFTTTEWDATVGEDYAKTQNEDGTERIIRKGDIVFRNHHSVDTIRDVSLCSPDDCQWWIFRLRPQYISDLAARFPKYSDEITAGGGLRAVEESSRVLDTKRWTSVALRHDHVTRPIEVRVQRSPACPQGRYSLFAYEGGPILMDGPLPFADAGVYRIAPGKQPESVFGYSAGFELLVLQLIYDMVLSAMVSNTLSTCHGNIIVPRDCGFDVSALSTGLNVLEVDGDAPFQPVALKLDLTPPEAIALLDRLGALMETIAGINATVRGAPESNLKSGAALALVASQAIQFNSTLQASYIRYLESMATGVIKLLQTYARVERVAEISGKSNRTWMRYFKNSDISDIERVTVSIGNPITKTTAGKLNLADSLLQAGLIKDPEQYLIVAQTGTLEPMWEHQTNEKLLVRSENERLMSGEPVRAIATDLHSVHIKEHKGVMSSPDARTNQAISKVTLDHIKEHITLLKTTDPALLALLGEQSLAAPAAPPAEQGAPAEAQGPGPDAVPPPNGAEPEMPEMPQLPDNPLTGEQYDPSTGGLN